MSELEPLPQGAQALFGERLAVAERYAELLADTGVGHGLIGPREVPRLWTRHILNCAVVAELLPVGTSVIDVGSGAGLPGIPLAIARPDVSITLVEPMLRRTRWLDEAVRGLGLDNVRIERGRAQTLAGTLAAPVVTARAVARLAELARWSAPLVTPGGVLLALKGSSADQELAEDEEAWRAAGFVDAEVVSIGVPGGDPTTVIRLQKRDRPRSA